MANIVHTPDGVYEIPEEDAQEFGIYQRLEEALVDAALNPTSKVRQADGETVHELPLDTKLIKELLDERIGGPQDWC